MKIPEAKLQRLHFLARVVQREIRHLQWTDQRLFIHPFSHKEAERLEEDIDLAERVDAFVSRFGRLQDTVGNKLLPHYLDLVGETPGSVIDNLNRVEKLGLIDSADRWMALRGLRNQMIHEYIEDSGKLVEALNRGHQNVLVLCDDAARILADLHARGLTPSSGHSGLQICG